jgi:hypothetical protein
LSAALWAARPEPVQEEAGEPATRPPAQVEAKYVINVYGSAEGWVIGDGSRVEQDFAAPGGTVQGSWEALIAQVTGQLDVLGEQLDKGVEDLKRGQAALYRQVDEAQREDLARILAAVQQGRLEQGEMSRTLEAVRRAMRAVMEEGPPMDAELRAAMADLREGVESSLSLERKLELTLPLIPMFLAYKMELAVDSVVDLHALWEELRRRFV